MYVSVFREPSDFMQLSSFAAAMTSRNFPLFRQQFLSFYDIYDVVQHYSSMAIMNHAALFVLPQL